MFFVLSNEYSSNKLVFKRKTSIFLLCFLCVILSLVSLACMSISKLVSLLCIISILGGLVPSVYAEDTETDFDATKTHVNSLQVVNPSLPSGVSQQR